MGGLVVGLVGYVLPATLGVGYDNIVLIFTGTLAEKALIMLFMLKFVSWAVALGSGTSSRSALCDGRRARRGPSAVA